VFPTGCNNVDKFWEELETDGDFFDSQYPRHLQVAIETKSTDWMVTLDGHNFHDDSCQFHQYACAVFAHLPLGSADMPVAMNLVESAI
jgi:hypothetical protein